MFRASAVTLLLGCSLIAAACGSDSNDGSAAGNGGSGSAGTAGSAPAPKCSGEHVAEAGKTVVPLSHGGRDRTYVLYVPQGYDASRPLPLVLNFHGYTSSAEVQLFFSGLGAIADERQFILAVPEGIEASWNSGNCCAGALAAGVDDVGFARAVVEHVSNKLCVDAERVYATGMSNGAFLAHRLACEAADVFAAVAPVAGVVTLTPEDCKPSRPISVMHFHGTEDTVVRYDGGGYAPTMSVADSMALWVDRNGCDAEPEETFRKGNTHCESYPGCRDGVDVTLCTVEGGGHCWPGNASCPFGTSTTDLSASSAMWEFMQQYTMP